MAIHRVLVLLSILIIMFAFSNAYVNGYILKNQNDTLAQSQTPAT